jgi:hypothetical protein
MTLIQPPDPRSWNVRTGGCGKRLASDVECDRPAGHLDQGSNHRAHDPSGSGAYIEYDDRGTVTYRHNPRHVLEAAFRENAAHPPLVLRTPEYDDVESPPVLRILMTILVCIALAVALTAGVVAGFTWTQP